MKKKPVFLLCAALFLATASQLPARTWTEVATGRTLQGDYVECDATHVIIKSGGRTFKIAIARLSDADKAFIENQPAKPAEPAAGPFAGITPPVSVKPLPVTGKGDDRKAGLEVTNNSDKAISRLVVEMFLLGQDGSVEKTVPCTNDGYFGEREKGADDHEVTFSPAWEKEDGKSTGSKESGGSGITYGFSNPEFGLPSSPGSR